MATKYCDHGLYAENAVFVGGVNAYGNTLTVTSVTSGRILIGMHIPGIDSTLPYGAIVTGYGSGSGGTGTYTLHTSINNAAFSGRSLTGTYGHPATVPIWGVAQDGDGEAKGAATPAVASVTFTGVPTAGVISVLGVNVFPTWATDANTCANNLAANINAATATAVGPASLVVKSQIRNHLYARGPANGAPAGTCQIMTRQGSAAHNGLIAVTHTLNNVSSPATVTFSGGASGAWGWLYGFVPMWPGSMSQFSYGIWSTGGSFCGTLAAGDIVNMRAGRSLVGYTFTGDGTAYPSFMPSIGTDAAPVTYVIDDGTVWPEDGPEPVLQVHMMGQAQTRMRIVNPGMSAIHVKARRYSDTKYGLELRITNNTYTPSYAPLTFVAVEARAILEGVHYRMESGTLVMSGNMGTVYGVAGDSPSQHRACRLTAYSQDRLVSQGGYGQNGNPFLFDFVDSIFDCGVASTAPHTGLFAWYGSDNEALFSTFDACRFLNFVTGSRLFPSGNISGTTASQNFKAHFRNCDFGGITVLGPKLGGSVAYRSTAGSRGVPNGFSAYSSHGKQDWFIDTVWGWAAWISTRNFPTLNARLRDGVSPWSMQVIPSQIDANSSKIKGFETPRIAQINSLPSGVRTLTLEFGLEQSLVWNKSDISVLVEYVDTDGRIRTVDTYDPSGGALSTSSAAWTNASGAQFTYSEAGVLYFNKYKLVVATPTAIAEGAEIGAIVYVRRSVPDSTKMIFIDPSLKVE